MKNINRFIEHTNLKPSVTSREIEKLVLEVQKYNFIGICVPPFWVKKVARDMEGSDVQVVTVIGFPLGYNMTGTKLLEIEKAMEDGADELDIVMNISAFLTGMSWAKIELAKCGKLIHDDHRLMKVIIETAYLTNSQIEKACKMANDAGADFVKTSTGFASSGAKVDDIILMRKLLPSNVGIKASGGIKTYDMAQSMIRSGADRIGTSSGIEIMNGK